MAQRLKVQIGVESESVKARLTPIDQVVDLPDHVETIIGALVLAADSRDPDPGDGEVDVPLTPALKKAFAKSPLIASLIPDDATAFIRVTLV
jgi:hypothetical protein